MARRGVLVALAVLLMGPPAGAAPPVPVPVIVPKDGNLQYLAFWVARGAGLFEAEGLDVQVRVPPAPAGAGAMFAAHEADVAVLPPPLYLELIAAREPVVLVANLLQNDPINLVVRSSVFDARKMSASLPLRERLLALRGLRVGVAYGPPTRLRALFAAQGLDADREVHVVKVRGPDQNRAFRDDDVDALYAHTPYVEQALLDQEAKLLVNQSAGEVEGLADRQIHALVVARAFAEAHGPVVLALTRAIVAALRMVHDDPARAIDAVLKLYPNRLRAHVDTIVRVYEPALPRAPHVRASGFATALELFPASRTKPDLAGIDLARHVDDRFVTEVLAGGPAAAEGGAPPPSAVARAPGAGAEPASPRGAGGTAIGAAGVLLATALAAFAARRRR